MGPDPVTPTAAGPRPRVAVAFAGDPLDPGAWSGTPLGIIEGLRAAGAEPLPVRAAPGERWDRHVLQALAVPRMTPSEVRARGLRGALGEAKGAARLGLAYSRLGSALARVDLRRLGRVDAVVQVGTSYRIRHPVVVTYEDMTIRQALGNPYFGWEHVGPALLGRRLALQTSVYQGARACCVATPWTRDSIVDDYGVDRAKVVAVGVGRNHDPVATERDWTRPRFLFVGKDWEDKNGPALVQAFARVRAEVPEATLDLVGQHPRIEAEGVTGHGFLRRDVAEERDLMASLFAGATCLVVPTTFEPAGIVYVEAAAAGLPCIGTSRGGARDLIGPGGVAVDPRDVGAIADAMVRLCSADVARRLGAAALRRAPLFTWTSVAERLLQTAGLAPATEDHWLGLFGDTSPL